MREVFLGWIIWLSILCIQVNAQEAVLYGERNTILEEAENTTRIFFDKNGDLYWKSEIPDSVLLNYNGALKEFFIASTNSNSSNFIAFQDSIRGAIIDKIQGRISPEDELYILVHGFRKPLLPQEHSTSSSEDYERVRAAIEKKRGDSKLHFIEIYWDGTYIQVARKLSSVIQLGKLFKKEAVNNSTQVGLGLRGIIAGIDHPKIHIIGHSLGAQVINNALWNANADSDVPTPEQEIHICLIAPAIGRKPFRKYDRRPSDISWKESDNYNFSIIYNERDIVVAKSNFGPKRYVRFTRFFGNTKLGCNCAREAEKVQRRFRKRYPTSSVRLYDASDVGNNHRWSAYAQSEAFLRYLDALSN